MEQKFKCLSVNSTQVGSVKDPFLSNGKSTKNSKNKPRRNKKCNSSDVPQDHDSEESATISHEELSPNGSESNLCSETIASLITQNVYVEPQGLVNVKNSCFLNASLQLLLHVPPLCALFKHLQTTLTKNSTSMKSQLSKHCGNQDSLLILLWGVFCQFDSRSHDVSSATVFERMNQFGISHMSSSGSPIEISSEIRRKLNLDSGIQEDVAECLTRILTQLHEELGSLFTHPSNNEQQQPPSNADDNDDDSDWIVTDRAGKRHPVARTTELDGGQSFIGTLFSGVLMTRSIVQVHGRSTNSDQLRQNKTFAIKEPFFILPLEIHHSKISSIESALRHLNEPEQVIDYRSASESSASVRRRTVIDRLPPYLLLQLKRFTYVSPEISNDVRTHGSSQSWSTQKCLKLISIDQEIIIPKALLSQEKYFTVADRRYRLLGVIFHLGDSATSGHYTTAVRWTKNKTNDAILSSTQFIYIDDTRLCMIGSPKSLDSLLCSHLPLNPESATFHPLPKRPIQSNGILYQARTPYILLYESYMPSST